MATFEIKSPDGQRFQITAPDGATDADVMAYAQKQWKSAPAPSGPNPAEDFGGLPFRPFGMDTGMTMPKGVSNFMAGAGKAGYDLARGAGQWLGAIDKKDVAETNRLDKPLMDTGAGIAGNITGNVAAALPTAFVPGANTYAGAAALSGAYGLLQPSEEGRLGQLKSGGIGAAVGPATMLGVRGLVAAGKGAKALTEPFYEGGRRAIVGRTLERFADDPARARTAAGGAPEYIPGSQPTLAEATLDPGLAQLQRAAQSADPRISSALANRGLDQNAARVAALQSVAGDETRMASATAARSAASDRLYGQAYDEGLDLTRFQSGASPLAAAGGVGESVKPASGLLTEIKRLGGIRKDAILDTTGERRAGRGIKGIPPALFTGNGLGLDELATQLRDKGYLIPDDGVDGGVQFLRDMIRDEVSGTAKHYSGREMDAMASRAFSKQQAANGIPQNFTRANDKIDALLQRPAMQQAVASARTLAANEGVSLETAAGSVKGLDYVKRALDDQIGKAEGNERRVLAAMKEQFLESVDALSPKYATARETYGQMSVPINRMQIGQELLKRGSGSVEDARGNPQLFASRFGGAMKNADTLAQNVTGFNRATMAGVMGPQMQLINALNKDLGRSSAVNGLAKSVGSNTAQNLSSQNIMRQLFGPLGMPNSWAESAILKSVARPMQFAYNAAEPNVQATLANALLDPKIAALMMMRQQPGKMGMLMGQAERYLPAASAGLLGPYLAQ
jgi:hypothetical protein